MKDLYHNEGDDLHLDFAALDALLGGSETDSDWEHLLREYGSDSEEAISGEIPPKASTPEIQKTASKQKKSALSLPSIFGSNLKRPLVMGIGAAILVLCLAAGVLIPAVLDPYDNRILPNTTIGDIPVGGMTRMEAYKAVKTATSQTFSQQEMTVTLPGGTVSLSPDNTKAKLKVWAAVSGAFQQGRKGTAQEKQAALEASAAGGYSLGMLPYLKLDQAYIRSQLEVYAAEHNVAHSEFSYRLSGQQPALAEDQYNPEAPHQTLELTLGTPTQELDVDAVLAEILNAYSAHRFFVTIDSIPNKTTPKAPDLDALYEEFYIAPVDTTLDMAAFRQIPGAYGYALDLEKAKELLSQADYGQTISIPMAYVKPDILGDETFFRDELGYCETKHTDNEDRNTNLRLACAALDGVIIQPGEEFSYNGTAGQRTADKGYKAAGAYSGYNTVNTIGGGVCQVSTTLYYATLIADMEIVFRINHGFRSSYIGVGLDATVSWPDPDFKFRNNSHFPVMIKAEVSDGYVKVRLLGTDEKDYYVKMTSGYTEDDLFVYSWSYKSKFDKKTDELISKEKEAYSCYRK